MPSVLAIAPRLNDNRSMSNAFQGITFGIAAGAFWGLSFLIPKSYADLTPGLLALARCGGFALISFAMLLKSRSLQRLGDRHWKMAIWLSITGYSVYFYLLIFAIRFAGIPISSLIIGLLPITISLASREPVRNRALFRASIAVIALGILLLNIEGIWAIAQAGGDRTTFLVGVLLSVISLASWTCFSVQNSRYLKANRDIEPARWASILGVYSFLTILPFAALDLAFGPAASAFVGPVSQHFVIATVVLGFGCSYVAGILWNTASRLLPTSLTGQLIVSETVFALLYGYIYDGAYPTAIEAVSILLLIGGVTMGIRAFLD